MCSQKDEWSFFKRLKIPFARLICQTVWCKKILVSVKPDQALQKFHSSKRWKSALCIFAYRVYKKFNVFNQVFVILFQCRLLKSKRHNMHLMSPNICAIGETKVWICQSWKSKTFRNFLHFYMLLLTTTNSSGWNPTIHDNSLAFYMHSSFPPIQGAAEK